MMKTCSKCLINKQESDFYPKRADCKLCKRSACRSCYNTNAKVYSEIHKKYYLLNKHQLRQKASVYYLANRGGIQRQHKQWSEKNRDKISRYKAQYYQVNKDRIQAYRKSHHKANRKRLIEISREYHRKHRDRLNAISRNYYQLHKREIYEAAKQRRKTDNNFRLKLNLSSRIRTALRANSAVRSKRTRDLIGCDIGFLKAYLQEKFTNGMSWNNYGKWHVDHVIPCAVFHLTNTNNQRACFHYSNLKPLWGIDNQRKSAKLPSIH